MNKRSRSITHKGTIRIKYEVLNSSMCTISKNIVTTVQSPSHVQFFVTQWTAAHQATCPSPSLEVCPNSHLLHWWCHPAISSSDALFSFCCRSSPASRTFPMNQLFTSGDQNTAASALAWVLPMSIQSWFPLRLTGLISLHYKRLSRVFSRTTVQKH